MASLFRVTVKPGLLKKDNFASKKTVKKIRRGKKASSKNQALPSEVAEYSD